MFPVWTSAFGAPAAERDGSVIALRCNTSSYPAAFIARLLLPIYVFTVSLVSFFLLTFSSLVPRLVRGRPLDGCPRLWCTSNSAAYVALFVSCFASLVRPIRFSTSAD